MKKKVKKIAIFSFIAIIIIVVAVAKIGTSSHQFDEKGLKLLLKDKACLNIETINIKEYENTGAAISDFTETYQIKLLPHEYSKIIEQVQDTGKCKHWKKIERGYQLSIPQKSDRDTAFIFFIDNAKENLIVQIIEE